jgi:hypothetical protein
MAEAKRYITRNLENFHAPMALPSLGGTSASQTVPGDAPSDPMANPKHEAKGYIEAIEAGLQMGVSGLVLREKSPDIVMSEHPETFMNIAFGAGQLFSDLPAMIVGGYMGAAVGEGVGAAAGSAVAPGPGTLVGAAVGGFTGGWGGMNALPTFLRHHLMDQYNQGDIKTGRQFMERIGSAFLESSKSFATGVAMGVAGGVAKAGTTMGFGLAANTGLMTAEAAAKVAPVASTIAEKTAEVAAMTTVAAGLDGHLPNQQDFVEGGMFMVGAAAIGAAFHIPMRLKDIYAKTGLRPEQVAMHAENEPTVYQDVIAGTKDGSIPRAYEPLQLADGSYPSIQDQGELYLPMNKKPNFVEADRPEYKQARLDAARRMDPKAYEAMDQMQKDLETLHEQSDAAKEKVTPAEREGAARLKEIRDTISKGEVSVDKQRALGEEEQAIQSKFGSNVEDRVRSVDNTLSEIARQAERIHNNKTIKERVAQAYQDASKTIKAPEREIVLDLGKDHLLNETVPGVNKDLQTPETTIQLADPNKIQLEEHKGLDPQLAFDENIMNGTADHPHLGTYWKQKLWEKKQAAWNNFDPLTHEIELTPKPTIADMKEQIRANPDLSDSEKSVLSLIGDPKSKETDTFVSPLNPEFKQSLVEKKDALRKMFVDQFHFLSKDPTRNTLDVTKDPYILIHKAMTYSGKVEGALDFGMRDFNDVTKKTSKGFWQIVGDNKKDYLKLKAYMMAERGLEIVNKGMDPGKNFDPEAANKVIEEGKSKYAKKAEELRQFRNAVSKYVADSGYMTKEQFDHMVSTNEAYLPWYREIDGGQDLSSKKGTGTGSPWKKMKGAESQIHDPFLSILKDTDSFIRKAEAMRAINAFIDGNLAGPEETRFEQVGFTKGAKGDANAQIIDNLKTKPVEKSADDYYTINRMKNGVKETFKVDKDSYDAFEKLGGDQAAANIMAKAALSLVRGITKVKRAGITLNPAYMVGNMLRDYQTSGVYSQYGNLPLENLKRAASIIKDPEMHEAFEHYLWSGGAHATFMEMDHNYIQSQIEELSEKTGLRNRVWNGLNNGIEKLAGIAELGEEATRFAEFQRHIQDKGITNRAIQEGGWASREITVDFSRVGTSMRLLRSMTAFQGAQIQGADRFVRAFQDDPKGTLKRALITATLPSLGVFAVQQAYKKITGDTAIDDSPNYIKDMYWQIPTYKGGPIIRVPKSQEFGLIFGSGVERVLNGFVDKNPHYQDTFAQQVMGAFVPTLVPDFIQPGIEGYMNKSFFTGNKLIPPNLEGLMPEQIQTPYTSEIAKGFSRLVGKVTRNEIDSPVNPINVDNWIRNWTGTIGQMALQASDAALVASGLVPDQGRAPWTLADIPVIKSFIVRNPSMGAQPVQDFYKLASDANRVYMSVQAELKAEHGDAAARIIQENRNLYAMHGALQKAQSAIGLMTKAVRNTNLDPKIPDNDKINMSATTYYKIIETSKTMLKNFKDLEEAK